MVPRRAGAAALLLFLPIVVMAGCSSKAVAHLPPTSSTVATAVPAPSSSTTGTSGSPVTTATTRAGTTTTTAATHSTVPAPLTVQLTDSDNGSTKRTVVGATLTVVLSSVYWMFGPAPADAVLQQVGDPTTTPAPAGTCVPGGGCGTVSATYKAVGPGDAQIRASRTTCGEGPACSGSAGSYSVEIVVSAG